MTYLSFGVTAPATGGAAESINLSLIYGDGFDVGSSYNISDQGGSGSATVTAESERLDVFEFEGQMPGGEQDSGTVRCADVTIF